MIVVLPVCWRDYALLINSLQWMSKLHGRLPFTAVLHSDLPANHVARRQVAHAASGVFSIIVESHYKIPAVVGWPEGPNYAFEAAVKFMPQLESEWLWCEPDAVAVRREWATEIESAYHKCGHPFFGPMVGGFGGHLNGTSVYPPDVLSYSPHFLQDKRRPFDVAMRDSIYGFAADASEWIQHYGPASDFPDDNSLNLVNWTTCLFHPCKNGSLIARLEKMYFG